MLMNFAVVWRDGDTGGWTWGGCWKRRVLLYLFIYLFSREEESHRQRERAAEPIVQHVWHARAVGSARRGEERVWIKGA